MSLYDAQYAAQAKETQAVREAVTEATMELEVWHRRGQGEGGGNETTVRCPA